MKLYRYAVILMACAWSVLPGFSQDIMSNLEAYWPFDESDGDTATDLSGNNRDAVMRNGFPAWVEGKVNGAAEFFGFDDFSTPGWKGIGGDQPRTITYWVKTEWEVNVPSGIVGWGFSTLNGAKWHCRLNESAANGTVGAVRTEIQGSYTIGSIPLNDGQWHHVASVLLEDGFLIQDIIHYVDGELETVSGSGNPEIIIDTAVDDRGTEVEIGSRLQGTAQQYFIGVVDEVRIYSRALTQADVQAVMQAGGASIDRWELY